MPQVFGKKGVFMKKLLLFIFILSFTLLMADSVSFETSIGNFNMSVEQSSTTETSSTELDVAAEIAKRVEYFEKTYFSKLNKLDQKRAEKISNEIYELLALLPTEIDLNLEVASQNNNQASVDMSVSMNIDESFNETSTETVVEQTEIHTAMGNSDFRQLMDNIENESFSDDKLTVVRMAAKRSYFTIAQLVQMVSTISFAEDQISAVEIVAPKIVDIQNSHNLLNAFTFSEDKKNVSSILDQY